MIFFYSLLILAAATLLGVALWNALAWPRVTADRDDAPAAARVSILIPARDEELNLAACLDAVLAQEGETIFEVLVYDDHSTDGTHAVIDAYASRDARVKSIPPAALPAGWCGKTFACAQLSAAARGEWLLFLDADARLSGEDAAARMLAEACKRRVTLLSCWPALELGSFWERALMPLLNFVVFTLYPAPLALKRGDASLGLAHGACLLAHAQTYARVGGHASVRDQLFEDVRLAQLWRARGEAGLCLDGRGTVSVRMYRSFAEIWRGFQKNFYPAFRRESSFWFFMATHLGLFFLPFIFAPLFFRTGGGVVFITVALCVLAMRAALALRFGHPWWSIALHPVGEAILVALGLSSWWRCKSGRGVEWKGRRYRAGAEV
ncbi:MAG TPA: glycosyltransferase [Pyrinomonadaceae bacterium]